MEKDRDVIQQETREKLFTLQDSAYRDFHAKLIPNIDPALIIGVRTPALRKFAKEYARTPEAAEYIKILPHKYYEENNLHGFLLELIKDYDTCVSEINAFLPFVDNWATCDLMKPKVFKKHLPELLEQIKIWIQAEHTYTIRFGIEMLMNFYLDDAFETSLSDLVAGIHSQEYYVNMMIAWYFATALAKQYEVILPYLEERRLDKEPHNKAIQKAVESYRISAEQKVYLKTLKIK